MSTSAQEWKRLEKLQRSNLYNITTYDASSHSKLRVVLYPRDERFNQPIRPHCMWAHVRDYDVPLLCFHGEKVTIFTPKRGRQEGKSFAKCKRTTHSCNYFVSFTRVYEHLKEGQTQIYPLRESQQVCRSAPQTPLKGQGFSRVPPAPQSSPIKRRATDGLAFHRVPKRVKVESLSSESEEYDSEPLPASPLAKRSNVKREPDSKPVASSSASARKDSDDNSRLLIEHMLKGKGVPEEKFKFLFKKCSACKTVYFVKYTCSCGA